MTRPVTETLDDLLLALGPETELHAACVRVGLHPDILRRLRRGIGSSVKGRTLEKLADVLQVDVDRVDAAVRTSRAARHSV